MAAAAIGKKKKKKRLYKPVVVRRNSVTRTSNVFSGGSIGTGELIVAAVAGVGLGILAYQYLFKKTTTTPTNTSTSLTTTTTTPTVYASSCRIDEIVERRINGGGCGCNQCKDRAFKFNFKNESF